MVMMMMITIIMRVVGYWIRPYDRHGIIMGNMYVTVPKFSRNWLQVRVGFWLHLNPFSYLYFQPTLYLLFSKIAQYYVPRCTLNLWRVLTFFYQWLRKMFWSTFLCNAYFRINPICSSYYLHSKDSRPK